jgi:putative tryptophan/tyrosine transport system substrate-binding protein
MSRWGIVGAFALAFFASPLAIQAQPPEKVFRIGLLGTVPLTNSGAARIWDGFFDGLRQLGYVEGRNVVIEGRYSEGELWQRAPGAASV